MKSKAILSFLILTLCGCIQNSTNKMLGTWVVEEFRVDGKNILWEDLEVNMVTFKQDGKCELPIRNLSLDDKAYWEVQEVNNIAVLSITGSKDTLFNRDFSFYLDKRKQGQATVDILELKSGNLFWKCSR